MGSQVGFVSAKDSGGVSATATGTDDKIDKRWLTRAGEGTPSKTSIFQRRIRHIMIITEYIGAIFGENYVILPQFVGWMDGG
jgi:hypothetical protein